MSRQFVIFQSIDDIGDTTDEEEIGMWDFLAPIEDEDLPKDD